MISNTVIVQPLRTTMEIRSAIRENTVKVRVCFYCVLYLNDITSV